MSNLNYLMSPKKIFFAGILTGVLDIAAAIVKFYIDTGRGPEPIFRYIASGVFGTNAFVSGSEMLFYGIIFHFLIAIIFAAIFLTVFPFIHKLVKSWIITGLLFGLTAWAIMNLVVVPLSGAPQPQFDIEQNLIAAAILIGMIGLPLAFIGRNYFQTKA